MATDLSGVLLKLDRAETHIQAVREQLRTFLELNPPPFGFRAEKKPGADNAVDYTLYAVIRQRPPRELALPIGDALHNIRSALDHLVYELAPSRSRKSRMLQFPIFTDECEFKVRSPPMIKGIAGDERTLIERVQPYCASNPPSNDPLSILAKLSNLDKHRLLVPMIAAVSTRDSWVAYGYADVRFKFIERGPVDHDTKIVAFTATPDGSPAHEMEVYPQSGLVVQLGNTGAPDLDLDVVELLNMLHHHVRHHVIAMWFEYGHMPRTWSEIHGKTP